MKILAFDTTAKAVTAAICEDERLLSSYFAELPGVHTTETLLPAIELLLKNASLTLDDMELIAVSAGPGSFTGVRIGVATAKGLAFDKNIPCAGVSSLLTMACDSGTDGVLCCSLKARPGESFYALFRKEGDALTRLTEDAVGKDEEMEAAASAHGATVFLRDCQRASGAAKAAWMQAQSGTLQNCHEILPAYLRLSQAERLRKERLEQ